MSLFDEILSVLEDKNINREVIYSITQVYLRSREDITKNGNDAFFDWIKNPGVTNIKSAFLAGYRYRDILK